MNVYLLVDTSRSMAEGTPPKIDYAKKLPRRWVTSASRIWTGSAALRFHLPYKLPLRWEGDESRCSVCLASSASYRAMARLTCDRLFTPSLISSPIPDSSSS